MKQMINTLKWFFAGWLVTFVVFQVMVYMKMGMSSIATLFQIISGIALGGLWQLNARLSVKNKET